MYYWRMRGETVIHNIHPLGELGTGTCMGEARLTDGPADEHQKITQSPQTRRAH